MENMNNCYTYIVIKLIKLERNDTTTEYNQCFNWYSNKSMILYFKYPIFRDLLSSKQIMCFFNEKIECTSYFEFIIKRELRCNPIPLFSEQTMVNYAINNSEPDILKRQRLRLHYYNRVKISESNCPVLLDCYKKIIVIDKNVIVTRAYINSLRSLSREELKDKILGEWILNKDFDIITALKFVNEIAYEYTYRTSATFI